MPVDFMKKSGSRLMEQSEQLALEMQKNFYLEHQRELRDLSDEEFEKHMAELIHRIGQSLMQMGEKEGEKYVAEWSSTFGKLAVESGLSVDRLMLTLPFLRKAVFDFIREEFKELSLSTADYFTVADSINPMLDQAVYAFTQAYVDYNETTVKQAQEELMELSVPVVPLTKEVAILPIIGTIDTHRSKELLDKSLNRSRELELSFLIVDMSGVHMIDTAIAHNLFQLNDALRVIGVTAVFSGLRPELAQTIVNLGISFDYMKVVSNLEQALKFTGLNIKEDATTLNI